VAQQPLQPVPGGQDLRQVFRCDDAAVAVEGDARLHMDPEVAGPGAALLEGVDQFRMRGDACSPPDEFHGRALVDIHLPADLAQERRREQPRHGAADDDGTAPVPPSP
jgi:hypothetical protein